MSQGIVSHPPPQQQHDPSHDSQVSMSQGSVFEGLLDDDAFDEIDLSQVSMSKGSVSHPPPPQQQQQQDPSHGSQISMSQGSVYEGMLDDDAFAEINLDAEHLAEQVRKQAGQSSAAAAPLQPQQQPAQRMAQLPSQIPALPHAPPTMPPQWRLQLDAEQHAVVRRDLQPGELLAVVAAAGAGKSTVLLEYARARPQLKCLFLSFAKADAEEKERTIKQEGLQNVEVKTTHSLAFLPTKRFHNRDVSGHLWIKWELLPVRTGSGLRTPKGSNVDASKLVESILGGFFASTDLRIQWTHLEPHRARAHQQVDKNGWDAVECAQNVWHVMCDPSDTRQKLTHDGYIKLFQLDRQMQKRVLGSYDVVMLDEAHDCTPAQIDIVEHANWCRRLAVYDPHQCIYQFRRARDADTLDSLPAVARLPLTQAYRYGAPLSEAASQLIRHYKGGAHSAFRISGSTAHSTELKPCSGSLADAVAEVASRARGAPFQLVALARLNKTLVVLAVELMQAAATSGRTHSLAFAGGKLPRASECLDVARLQLGAHRWGDVQDKFVRKFARHGRGGGFDEFKLKVQEENKAGDRQELADALDLLEQYGARPLEQHVHAIGRATARRHDEAELLFSTTHKSKGLGWPHVFLADDFMARGMSVDDAATAALKVAAKTPGATGLPVLGERALVRSPDRLFRLLGLDLVEEVNTTYVGMTRAKHNLFVPDALGSWLAAAGVSGFEALQPSCCTPLASSVAGPSASASLKLSQPESSAAAPSQPKAAAVRPKGASADLYRCLALPPSALSRMPVTFTSRVQLSQEEQGAPSRGSAEHYASLHAKLVGVSALVESGYRNGPAQLATVCTHLRAALLMGWPLRLNALASELRGTECPMPGPEQWRLLCDAERAIGADAGSAYVRTLKPIISTIVPEAGDAWPPKPSREHDALSAWYECGRWWAVLRRVGFTGRDCPVAPGGRKRAADGSTASAKGAASPGGARAEEPAAAKAAEEEDEVCCVGERSVEERNAEGFANAIDVDDESPARGVKASVETRDEVKVEDLAKGGHSKRERRPSKKAIEAAQGEAENEAPQRRSKRRRRSQVR